MELRKPFKWFDIENDVRTFAISQGICARKIPYDDLNYTMYGLPVTVFPSKIERRNFNLACDLQQTINELIYKISIDHQFLEETLQNLSDPFVEKLYDIYKTVRNDGYASTHQLGIFRSDYMIDEDSNLKQVEVNTISVSFAALAPKVSCLHRYTLKHYKGLNDFEIDKHVPKNNSLDSVAQALIDAHQVYPNPNSSFLFVIQEQEGNILDQKMIEWEIKSKIPKVKVYRRTFRDLDGCIALGPNKQLLLTIGKDNLSNEQVEISVVYFRTAYATNNFSYENSWELRLLLEKSRAIKCPSIQFQLAGFKIFQTLLSDRNCFDRYVNKQQKDIPGKLFNTFTRFWHVDQESREMIRKDPSKFVMKSNQEGGGNNIFGENIIAKLDQILEDNKNDTYFLMEFIRQKPIQSLVIQKEAIHNTDEYDKFKYYSIESELGIYGSILINSDKYIVFNRNSGHLLRSKFSGNNETGIVSSGGILDSPFLI